MAKQCEFESTNNSFFPIKLRVDNDAVESYIIKT